MRVIEVHEASKVPKAPIDGKPTIVYWNILGLVQSIRLALVCAKVDDFCDVRIEAGTDPTCPTHRQSWTQAKPEFQDVLTFPNLPYYLDDQVSLSQTNTILRHIGRRYNVLGKVEHLTDLVLDQLSDCEGQLAARSYGQGPDAVLEWFKSSVPVFMEQFASIIKNGGFISNDGSPCVADCKLYSFLYKMTVIQEQLGNAETASIMPSSLIEYMKRFEAVPEVAEYIKSSFYQKNYLNNPSAKWRG